MIDLRDLSVTIRGTQVLRDVDLRLQFVIGGFEIEKTDHDEPSVTASRKAS